MGIARILQEKGFIRGCKKVESGTQGILKISMRYGSNGEELIGGIKRVSKPGSRLWLKAKDVPSVHSGVGIAIVSTSKGLKTDEECREERLGGEVLCYVW